MEHQKIDWLTEWLRMMSESNPGPMTACGGGSEIILTALGSYPKLRKQFHIPVM